MSQANHIDLIEFPSRSPEELKATTTFFSTVFGWTYKEYGGSYSDTQDSGVSSGFNAVDSGRQSAPLAVVYVANLEATKQSVLDAGGKILQDIYEFPGGRRFHFTDPSNNELAAWSE